MDRYARMAGMAVFVVGIFLLIVVSAVAYDMFSAPARDLLSPQYEDDSGPAAASVGNTLVLVLVKIALLFVMVSAGSMIAARGIQMYSGCVSAEPAGQASRSVTDSVEGAASNDSAD